LSYTVSDSGLAGPAAAHFHGPAVSDANAGDVQGMLESPIKGPATLTDAQALDLTSGKRCFNIHTQANEAGEIRGKVLK
jgi:hypothetical protein